MKSVNYNFEKVVSPTLYEYDKTKTDKNYFITNYSDTFYDEVINMIGSSPVGSTVINNLVDRIVGKGIFNKTTGKKELGLTQLFSKITLDYIYFNQFFIKCDWNISHNKVLKMEHQPVKDVRYTLDENIFAISKNWKERTKKIIALPAFNADENSSSNQLYNFKKYTIEDRVYPLPFWFSCSHYIMIDKLIGTGLLNNMNNGLTQSFIVILKGEVKEEDMLSIQKNIKKNYAGQENAGGFVIINSESGPDNAPEIIAFPSNQNKENYDFINQISVEKILNAFAITSPILVGIERNGASLGNGTEMATSNMIFNNTVILPKREEILNHFEELLRFTTYDWNNYEVKDGDFYVEKAEQIKNTEL